MKIQKIEAVPFHAERDAAQATGTAGSPAKLRRGASPVPVGGELSGALLHAV